MQTLRRAHHCYGKVNIFNNSGHHSNAPMASSTSSQTTAAAPHTPRKNHQAAFKPASSTFPVHEVHDKNSGDLANECNPEHALVDPTPPLDPPHPPSPPLPLPSEAPASAAAAHARVMASLSMRQAYWYEDMKQQKKAAARRAAE